MKVKFKTILHENRKLKSKIGDHVHLKTYDFKNFCLKAVWNRNRQDWVITPSLSTKAYQEWGEHGDQIARLFTYFLHVSLDLYAHERDKIPRHLFA